MVPEPKRVAPPVPRPAQPEVSFEEKVRTEIAAMDNLLSEAKEAEQLAAAEAQHARDRVRLAERHQQHVREHRERIEAALKTLKGEAGASSLRGSK